MKTAKFSGSKGIRNDRPLERFETGELSSGTNIDIDGDGQVSRRAGYTKVINGLDVHSLYNAQDFLLYVDGTVLKRVGTALTAHDVVGNLTVGRRLSYAEVGPMIYYSNGVQTGKLRSGQPLAWGVQAPLNAPALTATVGDLPPGVYQVSCTFTALDNRESGAPRAATIELPAGGGIQLSSIPVATSPDVRWTNIYISAANGTIPYLTMVLASGTTTAVYAGGQHGSLPLRTQFLSPPPAGQQICHYNGRLYVASGNFLSYSLPYEHDLFDLRKFFAFETRITMLAPVQGGIFVGLLNETVFLAGDDAETFQHRLVVDDGVAENTAVRVEQSSVLEGNMTGDVWFWTSTNGVAVGADNGAFKNLTADRYIMPEVMHGAGLFKSRGGIAHYLSVLFK